MSTLAAYGLNASVPRPEKEAASRAPMAGQKRSVSTPLEQWKLTNRVVGDDCAEAGPMARLSSNGNPTLTLAGVVPVSVEV